MTDTVLILGAKGRFGRAACIAFHNAGWTVKAFARNWPEGQPDPNYTPIDGDAFDISAVIKAAQGCAVIVNALNPPYENWSQNIPRITQSVIAAAKASGASIMIPGNIYNFGPSMPPRLNELTPHNAKSGHGLLRIQMEDAYARAAKDGVQTIILRAGDFIEREKTGNWFDSYMTHQIEHGKITYPGPLNCEHSWAYLPDMALAMAMLAAKRKQLEPFSEFCFEGYNLTGTQLINAIERLSGRALKVSSMPWPIMRLMGIFSPRIKAVIEMRYLWSTPHALEGTKLSKTIKDFRPTPLDAALRDALNLES